MSAEPNEISAKLRRNREAREAAARAKAASNGNGQHAPEEREPSPEELRGVAPIYEPRPMPARPGYAPMETARELPHAVEAEQAVLSSLFQEPARVGHAIERGVHQGWFYRPAHQTLYAAFVEEAWEGAGRVDLWSFTEVLRNRGVLEAIGGASAVTGIYTFVPSAAALDYYLDTVREKFLLRQAIATDTESIQRAYDAVEDVDEFLLDRQKRSEWLSTIARPNKSALSVRTVSELLGMTFDDSDNYFGDRMIAEGQPNTVLGPGGIGKSRLEMQFAICMITGRDFLGMPTHAPGKKWLFIQTENNNRRLNSDLRNMILSLSLSAEESDEVNRCLLFHTIETAEDNFLALNDPQNYAAVRSMIQSAKPNIVVWDPLNTLTTADLNSDLDMRGVVTAISRLTREGDNNRVIIVLHHSLTGKAGAARAVGFDSASFGRNSKVLHAWTRSQINMAPRSPDDTNLLIMACGKNNNGKPFPELGVRFDEQLGIYLKDEHFDPAEFREAVGIESAKKKPVTPEQVAELIDDDGMPRAKLIQELRLKHGIASATAYRAIEKADEADRVRKEKVAKSGVVYYRIDVKPRSFNADT